MVGLLQVMSGASVGGAEAFFERLAVALPPDRVKQTVVVRRNAERERRLRANNLDTIALRFGGAWDLATRLSIKSIIRERHPRVVLAWMNRAASRCPRAVAGENYALVGRLGGYYNLKYYRHCHHLVANTRGIADYLVRNGWVHDRVHYLPNFVDAYIGPRRSLSEWNLPNGVPLLLAAGRLHPNKGLDVLIRALSAVPEAHLCIAGSGPLEASLRQQATSLGLGDRISWLGWVSDLGPLYQLADLFICPSRHEPLGNVVVEAWANGCPVVAAASEGPSELITHEVNGFLTPVDDAASLANLINALLKAPRKGRSAAESGLETFRRLFSRRVVVEQYVHFFETVTP